MMTIASMAEYICDKVGQSDSETLALAKKFLRQRYEMIWMEELWRDSLVMVDISVDADAGLGTVGQVLVPQVIEEVVAARKKDDQQLHPENFEVFMRYDRDLFENAGTPTRVMNLGPCVWAFPTSGSFSVKQKIDATDDGSTVTLRIQTATNEFIEKTLEINTPVLNTYSGALVVESFSKPTTNQDIVITDNPETETLVTIPAATMIADRRQRIQLVERPDEDLTIRVLGKRRFLPLEGDTAYPLLSKCTNALLAFAEADLYQLQRQIGKKRESIAEGMALLGQLKNTEVYQRSSVTRFIPDTGGEYEWDFHEKGNFA